MSMSILAQYRNITSAVKGLYSVKNVTKEYLDHFMSFPYVRKVDVVEVVSNKIDSDPKTYSYRGFMFNEKDAIK